MSSDDKKIRVTTHSRLNWKKTKDYLISKYGEKCFYCGDENGPFEIHHLVPIFEGGDTSVENCVLTCPTCHRRSHIKVTELEILTYLVELMQKNDNYTDIQVGERLGEKSIADIIATRRLKEEKEQIVIELKSETSFTSPRFNLLLSRFRNILQASPKSKFIFAFLGELSEGQEKALSKIGIEIWDRDKIAFIFQNEIQTTLHPWIQQRLRLKKIPIISKEKEYIKKLKAVLKGKKEAIKYQKLMHEIITILFCPPLSPPLYEIYDKTKTNRRDHILPNYSNEPIWSYLRDEYSAHFIVLDSKNYVGKVTKTCVLQMANYLKYKGTGKFGIIIARNDGNKSCKQTILEKWLMEDKMIIILTDEDIEKMLIEKSNDRAPEIIIRQKIEDFRVSI